MNNELRMFYISYQDIIVVSLSSKVIPALFHFLTLLPIVFIYNLFHTESRLSRKYHLVNDHG